jgi:hypothetical protein
MDDASSIHGESAEDATIHQVQYDGIQPHLYGVSPHSQNDHFAGSGSADNMVNHLPEIISSQYLGKRLDPAIQAPARRPRLPKIINAHLAGSFLKRI